MMGLRIILDKSVVFLLGDAEVDTLDRYYFSVIPPILANEILADLTKESDEPDITSKIAHHTYRISGNRGLMIDYRNLLAASLAGQTVPMDGRFVPLHETMVRSESGSIGAEIKSPHEDEMLSRWEQQKFTTEERIWARRWRKKNHGSPNPNIYLKKIKEAGLSFEPAKTYEGLHKSVGSLLAEPRLQGRLLYLLFVEHKIPLKGQELAIKRWFREGRPMISTFAPYAAFCLRVDFLWALGMVKGSLFVADKNDRKDREYCYYIPHCEIFSSRDKRHRRLVPFLLRTDQHFVDGDDLKVDLKCLTNLWDGLSREEQIDMHAKRGLAPPELDTSVSFRLWKDLRGTVSPPMPLEFLKARVVDSRLPKDQQVEMSVEDMFRSILRKMKNAEALPNTELANIKDQDTNPASYVIESRKMTRARIKTLHPQVTDEQLNSSESDD